jgi:hypothetical protein
MHTPPSNRNFESYLNDTLSYVASWQTPAPAATVEWKRAKEERGGIRRPKPSGWKEPLPYFFVRRVYDRGQGTLKRTWTPTAITGTSYRDSYSGVVGGGQGSPVDSLNVFSEVMPLLGRIDFARAEDELYAACYKKVRDATLNISVAAGEVHKTANLVASTAYTLTRAVHALRRGKYKHAAAILGVEPGRKKYPDWASKWLEWKYGWMPLLSDIESACEHIAKRELNDWRLSRTKWRRYDDLLKANTIVGSGFSRCNVVTSGMALVKVRMDFIPADTSELSMLGLTNPVLTAWELAPYSFVVDWLVPVGDWLLGLDHAAQISSGTACITRFVRQEWSAVGVDDAYTAGGYHQQFQNSWKADQRYVNLRRRVTPLLPPDFPRLKNPLTGLTRMVTALALLKTAFKR